MAKRSRLKVLQQNTIAKKVGKRPGYLYIPENSWKPRFFLMSFSIDFFQEQEFARYDDLLQYLHKHQNLLHWIDIRGYDDLEMLERIIQDFNIHTLQMEDVINDYQRPKVEETDGRLFIVSRMVRFSKEQEQLLDDQLSIFTGENYVLTLQKDYQDCLEPLRERIRGGKGIIRQRPAMYIAYALIDVVLDHYFPAMAEMGDTLEELEDLLMHQPDRKTLNRILSLKREVVKFRRIAWPERDKMNELIRMVGDEIPENLRIYFKDAYDHSVQVLDLVDNYKEMSAGLVELYLSNVSNRMNEIMKVLTIISSIFIPLSFIVGLYGMNFSRENPNTGEPLPYNMPELYHPLGYPILLVLIFLLVLFQFYFFYKKGWLKKF
ncbi:MAG: magnesium/cobalt transporter CorA [Hymenobacteraceae bacterium]|nr:magnesium/cobalt transporter CorA [Hymenobacteraceae bacterium]MDX5395523.1 magnesium/cobalt transporter CorA [Hymenobacteraceae bacterium]MDX5443382.1 magnesium/cobalt transporter CorA [Hymenobacteraceae bacterium]MDX5511577.1 magnesium/cobalt transporter CorA [Hymenobacteraceae bacterium]